MKIDSPQDPRSTNPAPRSLSGNGIGWRAVLAILAFWTLYGVVTTAGLAFSPLSEDTSVPVLVIAAIFLGAYTWAALTLPLFRLTRALNRGAGDRPRTLIALAVIGFAVAAAVSVSLATVSWLVLVNYGLDLSRQTIWLIARFRFLTDLLACLLILAAGVAVDYFLRYQERQREASELRAQLVESRLQFLRSQLNPHFLSNTMNAISALVSKDPKGVRRMIARLSELLRYTLDASSTPEVTLEQELNVLRRYLEILEIRFQGRLRTHIDADPDLLNALVPNLILQPLAENAMEHGVSQAGGHGEIAIRALRKGGEMVLSVEDTGAGGGPAVDGVPGESERASRGYGLRHARDRLEQLYGDRASLRLWPSPAGGTLAEIRLPLRFAGPEAVAASAPIEEPGLALETLEHRHV